jgi:hypothetical protein
MTTYVLVHGDHHGGWCYQKVARPLVGHSYGGMVMAELLEADRAWEIDTGRDLMVTEPDKVTAMLLRLG